MKKIIIIPARWGSSRLEGKPLLKLAGKTMIQHVYENCKRSVADDVFIATDDERIIKAAKGFNAKYILTSPDNRSGTDRAAEAAENLGLEDKDIIINIQGDQPLVHPESIREVIRPFEEEEGTYMSTLGYIIQDEREIEDPKDIKLVMDKHQNALYFSRASIPYPRDKKDKPEYIKHLGVYAYSYKFLKIFQSLPSGRLEEIEKLEQLRVLEHGYKIKVLITEHDSPEVDLPEDIARIEARMKNQAEL